MIKLTQIEIQGLDARSYSEDFEMDLMMKMPDFR